MRMKRATADAVGLLTQATANAATLHPEPQTPSRPSPRSKEAKEAGPYLNSSGVPESLHLGYETHTALNHA